MMMLLKTLKNMKNFTKRRVFAEMKYIYEDHEKHTTWECEAEDLLAADKLYEAAGCRMSENAKRKKSMPNDVGAWSPDWACNKKA
jgi:hypothetical protein